MTIRVGKSFYAVMIVAAAVTTGVAASTEGKIEITGAVAENCRLSLPSSSKIEIGDLQKKSSHTINFAFSCNAPFSYALESANGALVLDKVIPAIGRFSTSVPYQIDVDMPSDGGPAIMQTVQSRKIRSGGTSPRFADSAGRTGINKTGALKLTWSIPDAPLLAGNYQDRLTLMIDASAP